MTVDVLIRGATVVDGTGAAPVVADVAVHGGRVVAVGKLDERAGTEVDGRGQWLTPGFVDVHTHYDAQLLWDPLATPSVHHGVTTVVTGNCSLSMAPVGRQGRDAVASLFEQIEDFPTGLLERAVSWGWEDFPSYLRVLQQRLGVNVAPLLGLSTLRQHVMGEAAWERVSTDEELARMCAAVRGAMAAGALGVSGSDLDVDDTLRPVPARVADARENLALAQAMMEGGRGVWQTAPMWPDPAAQLQQVAMLAELTRRTGCVGTFAKLFQLDAAPDVWRACLALLDHEGAHGARVFAQVPPRPIDLSLRLDGNSFLLLAMPTWKETMRLPLAVRLQRFASPLRRKALLKEAASLSGVWDHVVVERTFTPGNAACVGRRLTDVAAERGRSPAETLLDLSVADGLRTVFGIPRIGNGDDAAVATMVNHPWVLVGGSDAGAHLAQFCGAGDAVFFLETFVQKRGTLSVEAAVHHLTARPARALGLVERGVIAPGAHADLVLLDPATLHHGAQVEVADLPDGGRRLTRESTGITHVWVNGVLTVKHGMATGALGGALAAAGPVARRHAGSSAAPTPVSPATRESRKTRTTAKTPSGESMRYVMLGRTGMRVSELCLGTMTFGTRFGFGAEKDACRDMLNAFVERGGNFIDTANQYNGGQSEELLGELLEDDRDRMVVATKYTLTMDPSDPNASGNHRKNLVQSLEASLRRLRTDRVDILYVHAWDFASRTEDVMRALDDVVRSGKALSVAVSDTPAWVVSQANTIADLRGWSAFAGLQVEYSLTERTAERDLIPMANALDLSVLAWGPLAGGLLTGKYNRPKSLLGHRTMDSLRAPVMEQFNTPVKLTIAQKVMEIARAVGQPAAAVATNWIRQRPGSVLPIMGARTSTQLKESLACLDFVLSDEHMAALDEVSAVPLGFPHDFVKTPWLRTAIWGEHDERIQRRS